MIDNLPLNIDIETKSVLKKTALAERHLAELKGIVQKVPNEAIILNTLSLREAKTSSAIENIVTTNEELYKSTFLEKLTPHTKEVNNYNKALLKAWHTVKDDKVLSNVTVIKIFQTIKGYDTGFRVNHGTTLTDNAGKTIYTPPQDEQLILNLMSNLEEFINDDSMSDINPLIKMALIHHQFESIHPFPDGNGRTGRIINILYLVLKNLLDTPILYLSKYIIENRSDYYSLLQEVREKGNWEEWILFVLDGVINTSKETTLLVEAIYSLFIEYKNSIRINFPKIYSQDFINSLFEFPYTKISFISKQLGVSRQTASVYLKPLTEQGLLKELSVGRDKYFINERLCEVLMS